MLKFIRSLNLRAVVGKEMGSFRNPLLIAILLLMALVLSLISFSCSPQTLTQEASIARFPTPAPANEGREQPVTVSGHLRLAGNEPFIVLALETAEGKNYGIVGRYEKPLHKLASKGNVVVRVKGYLKKHGIDVQSYEILHLPKGGVLSIYLEYFEEKNGRSIARIHKIEFEKGRYLAEGKIVVPGSTITKLYEVIDGLHQHWVEAELVPTPPPHYYVNLQITRPISDKQISLWLLPNSEDTDSLSSKWMMQKWKKGKIISSPELSAAFHQLLVILGSSIDKLAIGPPQISQ